MLSQILNLREAAESDIYFGAVLAYIATVESLSIMPAKWRIAWWYFFNASLYYFLVKKVFPSFLRFSAAVKLD